MKLILLMVMMTLTGCKLGRIGLGRIYSTNTNTCFSEENFPATVEFNKEELLDHKPAGIAVYKIVVKKGVDTCGRSYKTLKWPDVRVIGCYEMEYYLDINEKTRRHANTANFAIFEINKTKEAKKIAIEMGWSGGPYTKLEEVSSWYPPYEDLLFKKLLDKSCLKPDGDVRLF